MCDLAPTEIAGSDALNRDQLLRRKVATPNRVNTVGRACSARRLLRVLVVDDVRDTADGLARLVRRWGHDTRSAYDGVTGLKVAAAQEPDVVLLDIALPDMDDVMDDLQKDLFRAILTADSDPPDEGILQRAVQMALVGRYYERVADHAVQIGRWVAFMVTGDLPRPGEEPAASGNA
jgi:CheY-like chemotaxis protein